MLHPRSTILATAVVLLAATCGGCKSNDKGEVKTPRQEASSGEPVTHSEQTDERATPVAAQQAMTEQRHALVEQLRRKGITDERVLAAINEVPRHELVPDQIRHLSYKDRPLPIGEGQTISQPYIVALMSQLADVEPGDKVLEVGTGSGYQGAVLAELTDKVYTIEIIEALGKRARKDLERMGYGDEIEFRIGDGYAGWPEGAPFDAIVVTAAPPKIPEPLKAQLAEGGRMVIPVGETGSIQQLKLVVKEGGKLVERSVTAVRFVPMTGTAQETD